MAQRGRPVKPTALKILDGNPGKRPLHKEAELPPMPNLRPPTWLLPDAKKEWRRLAPALQAQGLLTTGDTQAFAGYCQAYARWKEAEEWISTHSAWFRTQSGYMQQVPQVSIANNSLKTMQSLAAEFGLTPAARARISGNTGEKYDKESDPMEALLKGAW